MAKDIYVKNTGSNSNNGLTSANPVQTTPYALSIASATDRILTFAGDRFQPINQNKSGINWDVYGGSDRSIVSGFVTISGWINNGGGIWRCVNSNLQSKLNKVNINGVDIPKGRYPKFNSVDHGFLTISNWSTSSKNTITNSALGSMPNLVGAEVVPKSSLYTADIPVITSHSGNTIVFSGSIAYGGNNLNGYGFFIQNHISTLTEFGEWSYNGSTKTVYMYFGSENPNDYVIRTSASNNCITASGGIKEVQFNNMIIEGSNSDGAGIGGANTFTFDNVEIRNIGGDGVNAPNHPFLTVTNSHIHDINNCGVWTSVGASNALMERNLVEKIGMDLGMTKGGLSTGGGYGLHVPWGGTRVLRNTVRDCGYIGIRFEKAYSECSYNHIHDVLQRFSDGGGIYNWNASTNLEFQPGMKCNKNIIHDIPNITQGTTYGSTLMAQGLYHDDQSAGSPDNLMQIHDNAVWNIEGAAYNLRNCKAIELKRNLSFNAFWGLRIVADSKTPYVEHVQDMVSQDNIWVAKNANEFTMALHMNHGSAGGNIADWVDSVSDWNNNVYARPISEGAHIKVQNGQGSAVDRTLPNWKPVFGWDTNSLGSPVAITNTNQFRLEDNPSESPVTINLNDGTYIDMYGTTQPSFIELSPHSAKLLIKTADAPPTNDPIKEVYREDFEYNPTQDINPIVPAILDVVQGESQMDNPTTDVVWDAPSGSAKFLMDFDRPTQTGSTIAGRTEQTTRYPALMEAEEMWFSGSYLFPLSYENDPEDEVIYQWHAGDIGGSPSFSIRLRNGRFVVYLWIGSGFLNQMAFDIGEAVRDTWHQFIVKLKMHPTDGQLTVWKDGLLARCHNPLTGDEWIVPTTPPGGGITNDYTAYPDLGSIQQTSGGASLLVWNGKTARGTYPNPTKYPKWGFYKSAWGTRYNSDKSIKPESYIEGDPLYVSPEFREKISYIDNIKFETRLEDFTNIEIFTSLDKDGNAPLETPIWWEYDPVNPEIIINTTPSNPRVLYPNTLNIGVVISDYTPIDKIDFYEDEILIESKTDEPWSLVFVPTVGSSIITATATDINNLSANSNAININVFDFQDGGRINVGTDQDVAYQGSTYYGDRNFVDLYTESLEDNVSPDTTEPLFLTGRAAPIFSYTIPVNNGRYNIKTMHNEPWFGIHVPGGAGKRVFDISINGVLVKSGFDIYVKNNNQNTTLLFEDITVTAREIVILLNNSNNKANLSGIEITPFVEPDPIEHEITVTSTTGGSATGGGSVIGGEQATLTATPSSGFQFVRWEEDDQGVSTDNPYVFIVSGDRSLEAIFEPIVVPEVYEITVTQTSGGVVTGEGSYNSGDQVQLVAIPDDNMVFVRWSDDTETNPYIFNASESIEISAVFAPAPIPPAPEVITVKGKFRIV